MPHDNSTRKLKRHRIRAGLALGLALPSLVVFGLSAQAQIGPISTSKKTTIATGKVLSPSKSNSRFKVAKPSSGIHSSVSKKPNKTGSQLRRSSSFDLSSKLPKNDTRGSTLNRSVGNLRKEPTTGASILGRTTRLVPSNPSVRNLVPDSGRGDRGLRAIGGEVGNGMSRPPILQAITGRSGGRFNTAGPQSAERKIQSRLPAPVTNPTLDLSQRIPQKPVTDVGKFLPGSSEDSASGIKSGSVSSIIESNRKFDNILASISKLNPKPLDTKDLVKELPKLTLPPKDKSQLNMHRQEVVMGARKTMMHRIGVAAGCNWWADLLCGWHWHRHGCHWTDIYAVPGYWSCWRPCHYRVVWCPTMHGHVRSAWYFGIESFLIPDMHALGVHEVSPYSPAALAGLQPGDMILSVNGYAFDTESVLPEMIQTSSGLLNLEVYREGLEAPMVVQVRLRRLRITSY